MTKRETIKFIVQMIASIATAIVTALGATSCMGMYKRKEPPSRVAFLYLYFNFIYAMLRT